jgi:small GTP-binding protein
VGKTTLVYRYITESFDTTLKKTMGVNLSVKFLDIDGTRTNLQIWDFGGEDTFRFLLPSYAFGSFAGIFMYDITNYQSLKHINEWIPLFREGLEENKKDIPILLVGGKADLENERVCSLEDTTDLLDQYNLFDGIECSSKSGKNVELVFDKVLKEIKKYLKFSL